jgi:small subunit ribosomal protein S15
MNIAPEIKKKAFKDYGKSEFDTGSPEGQIALFTHKIQHLTEHLKVNKKDVFTERSLVRLVGKRRKMLDYLKAKEIERYRAIIKKLKIRK